MKKIGIIGAMELEVETLKEHMSAANITKKANMEFYEGTLNGADVVIVRSGIGKVNAALCVQILADLFHVTAVINTGVDDSSHMKEISQNLNAEGSIYLADTAADNNNVCAV